MRTTCLLLLLLLSTACHKTPAPPPAGTGFKQLTWTLEPGPGSDLPKSRGTLRYDGTGTLDSGKGSKPITVGPYAMAEIEKALEAARPHANGTFGDCTACDTSRIEVQPVRGAKWTLEQHGDAGPEPVKKLFFGLLHGFRPGP